MAYEPRGYVKKQSTQARQRIMTGDKIVTGTLNETTTVETVQLGMVAQKMTVQSTDTLAGDVEVSANGIDFVSAGSFIANTPLTYSTNLFVAVKVTRTGGSGKLSILAV